MPHNAGYYHAAYIIVAVVYGAYALSLWLRLRAVRRKHDQGSTAVRVD